MRVVVLTSRAGGTAAHHLPFLLRADGIDVAGVVLSGNAIVNRRRHLVRKLSKTLRIGPLGALNGVRMRRWYNEDVARYVEIRPLGDVCADAGVALHRTPRVNCDETRELFRRSGAEIGLSLGNGYIAESVFAIPSFGMLNIHHELLPEYRNAQSVVWQIHNGSAVSGFTIHRIDRHIDAGEIVWREPVPIIFGDTLGETVARTSAALLDRSAAALVRVLHNLERCLSEARPQGPGSAYTTPSFRQYLRMERQFRRLRAAVRTGSDHAPVELD